MAAIHNVPIPIRTNGAAAAPTNPANAPTIAATPTFIAKIPPTVAPAPQLHQL